MTDEQERHDHALISNTRNVPAKNALVRRGVALAEALLAKGPVEVVDTRTNLLAAAEKCVREAMGCQIRAARLFSNDQRDDLVADSPVRFTAAAEAGAVEAYRAYFWALVAVTQVPGFAWSALSYQEATGLIELSFSEKSRTDRLTEAAVRVAHQLRDEAKFQLDISSDLIELNDALTSRQESFVRAEVMRKLWVFLYAVVDVMGSHGIVLLPSVGETTGEGDVIRVFVRPGDILKKDEAVIEIETDKAFIEIPSTGAGRVKQVMVKVGDKIKAGEAILTVEDDGPDV